ncbi:heme biosynthesis HemY N-terminal domain-containing protein [Francisella sp. SYW-9]|uniref:heme biosynthesis HemY N-terminal domain-containing protein n=1 Tax=Francisella sp. SYW-9 TaxID=2610888 RepID=UPI00123D0415|nr:heme biosynthesis HemY N-terminal domain-containing protein [Francisella sp. SYW-9]
MINIIKLIIAVIIATIVGIWATKYHGYIMLVLSDKTIKMNLVAFVFAIAILFFLIVFGVRIIRLIFSFPYLLFSWFFGLFVVDKQEKFIDIVADISLENNKLMQQISVSALVKLTPKYLRDYILFRKFEMISTSGGVKELEKSLKQLKSDSLTYKYFEVYKFYMVQKLGEAKTRVLVLLECNDNRFLPSVANLAGSIALSDKDDTFALKILEKYDAYLRTDIEEKLIILALKQAENVDKLSDIYTKSDTTPVLSRVYLEQLVGFNEMTLAEKFAKKQLNNLNLSTEMLRLYVNALGIPVSKLVPKILDKGNSDYSSIITLLELAVVKSDNVSFKMIYDYIERNIKDLLSKSDLEKYSHILCKFFIKNGETAGLDLSEARLVYRSN